jgi:hypothetical protein
VWRSQAGAIRMKRVWRHLSFSESEDGPQSNSSLFDRTMSPAWQSGSCLLQAAGPKRELVTAIAQLR